MAATKTPDELVPFVGRRVSARLDDGRSGQGILRVWDHDVPVERQFALDPSGPTPLGWHDDPRFYASDVAEIHLA